MQREKAHNIALSIKIKDKSIIDITSLSVRECFDFFDRIKFSATEEKIAQQIIKELRSRLKFLIDVGLEYLTLERKAGTLSGGEAQRIRLATQIGSRLVGVYTYLTSRQSDCISGTITECCRHYLI